MNNGIYDLYNSYLNQIVEAQRIADQQNVAARMLASPVINNAPNLLNNSRDEDEGIMSLAPTNSTGTFSNPLGNVSYTDVLGFIANPIAFGINKGIGKVVGKTPAQMLQDAISNMFGGGGADTVGTAADPSTMASEDPSAIGSQSPGGSESGGGSAGADAASAAGANDDASTGGPF